MLENKTVLQHLQGEVNGERMVSSRLSSMVMSLFSVWATGLPTRVFTMTQNPAEE